MFRVICQTSYQEPATRLGDAAPRRHDDSLYLVFGADSPCAREHIIDTATP